ncbi:MAG: ferrous iron transport protein B [Spirochaetes bacterium GWF1_51_8]|nr:MAG: ferrous iron transport protein B [Spirochaetes bacterium GWF1_51_8]
MPSKKSNTPKKTILIAVAGNPNCGKSTLINAIAGSHLYVGNWPGVTVEKKEAQIEYGDYILKFTDLPGTYSLTPHSDDERVAVDFLTAGRPDILLNVVDSTNLERNLTLTMHLLELEIPAVIALNMSDEAEKKGLIIDQEIVRSTLGAAVVKTSAVKKAGIASLLDTIVSVYEKKTPVNPAQSRYSQDIELAAAGIESCLSSCYKGGAVFPLRWAALRLIESDEFFLEKSGITDPESYIGTSLDHLHKAHRKNLLPLMDDERFARANGLAQLALKKPPLSSTELTDRIDKIALNRFLGIPLFLVSMWLMFKFTFDIGNPFVDWFDSIVTGPFSRWAQALLDLISAPAWLDSLIVDGIIAGVGGVLVFVPLIFLIMFFVTFLEGSGYMARAAFLMDGIMHKMGLHGKSFIPLVLGFGCNVPSVYATRILDDTKDKVITVMISPLISCAARLPVYVLFAAVFFPVSMSGTVIWSLYLLGILLAFLMGWLLRKILFKGETHEFIMELPPYRMPSLSNLLVHTWDKVKHFMVKAGTVILALTVIIWFMTKLPWGVEKTEDSFLGQAGKAIAPIFAPLGFGNWQASASLITGLGAKEVVVSTMATIYVDDQAADMVLSNNAAGVLSNSMAESGTNTAPAPTFLQDLGEIGFGFLTALKNAGLNLISIFGIVTISADEEAPSTELSAELHKTFTPLSAYAFLVFVLLYVPCITYLAAMKHELVKWKWVGITVVYQLTVAWVMAFIIFQGGTLLGLGG